MRQVQRHVDELACVEVGLSGDRSAGSIDDLRTAGVQSAHDGLAVLHRAWPRHLFVQMRGVRLAEPAVVGDVDHEIRLAVIEVVNEAGDDIFVADERQPVDILVQGKHRLLCATGEMGNSLWQPLLQKRKAIQKRDVLAEGQQHDLAVLADDLTLRVQHKHGIEILAPATRPSAADLARTGGHVNAVFFRQA